MTHPILFKKSSTGALQRWRIWVEGSTIYTEHGQVGGKLQTTSDTITEGKNAGRTNATTAEEQAVLEAAAKHTKQLKKGYVDDPEVAEAGGTDDVIEGGILPMLAPSQIYPAHAKKLMFPHVYVQPKLDGQRCIAIVKDGKCGLWTRTRKPIRSLPHIVEALEKMLPTGDHTLDGEAYADSYAADFEELMSVVRKDYPDPEGKYKSVEYHVYDNPGCTDNFAVRSMILGNKFLGDPTRVRLPNGAWKCGPVVQVVTVPCSNHDEILVAHEENLAAGYEGSMVRGNGPYEGGKRSVYLQKLKNFSDADYRVIGADEGRGKDAGTVGAFVCETPEGKEFRCRLKASYQRRRELFQNPKEWQGKLLVVRYQNLSSDGIPRFPIGKGLREASGD